MKSALLPILLPIFAATASAQPENWYERPLFSPAKADMSAVDLKPLLEAACLGRYYQRTGKHGPESGCRLCPKGSDFAQEGPDFGGVSIEAVTFGHLIAPDSEDALLSSMGCESHSNHFGGTFLLTRRGQVWKLLGYKSSIITEQCHKLTLGNGREGLVCAWYFGAQGLMDRLVYAVDYGSPRNPRVTNLLSVENGLRTCGQDGENGNPPVEQSDITNVVFSDLNGDGLTDVSIFARTGKIQRTEAQFEACQNWIRGKPWKNPPPVRTPAWRVDYLMTRFGLVPGPHSAATLKKHFPWTGMP